jgi:hypothetical protein
VCVCVCVCVFVCVSLCMDVGVECVSVSVYGSLCLCVSWLAVRVCVFVILCLCAESRKSKVQVSSQASEDSRERLMTAMTVFLEKQPQGPSEKKQAVSTLWQTRYMDAARLVCRLSSSASH